MKDDEEVQKFSVRDVAVVVFIDHFEHAGDERGIRLKSQRFRKL